MPNRIALGNARGLLGLWVSKPGWNVLDAPDSALMLSTDWKSAQVIKSGIFSAGTNQNIAISWPDQGFVPTVVLGSPRFINCRVTSLGTASANVNSGEPIDLSAWTEAGSRPNPPAVISYAVLGIPIG